MTKYLVVPCNGEAIECTNYEEAERTLRRIAIYSCGPNCYPHRHKLNVVGEETTREVKIDIPTSMGVKGRRFFVTLDPDG